MASSTNVTVSTLKIGANPKSNFQRFLTISPSSVMSGAITNFLMTDAFDVFGD